MIIAVPTADGTVDQHFGSAREFTIYHTDEFDEIAATETVDAPGTGYEAILPVLIEKGVKIIICGRIGAYAVQAIKPTGIMLMGGASGNAADRVNDFLGGTLKFYSPSEPIAAAPAKGDAHGKGDGLETDGNVAACGDNPVCTL
ncbi:NifB/NifX family molybdenum-iron cluster-binding protein [[Clostridium] aminophilum]|uniref:NifB/NifX family molybdenum-iron cluster-binding protein n=1 Tax=[Clostridium] aminophilum TaxID=1526 RepID=UPI0026F15E3E|nr:NifB/NifX family molybdenum-iron cluster-binding protein [[Clostridium] aminophilum]MDD6195374.1 NifB/NifX family molybdenum-iron cluster-binding protein [[Clostridium] aminophilum]